VTREDIFSYVKKEYKVEPDYPFDKNCETAVLRHENTRKWFALVMYVKADKLGYDSEELLDVVTMKSEPMLIDALVTQEGFHRAYHMNKTQWLTIELGRNVTDDEIKNLIDMSFELTEKQGRKK
jgi:predicted DNA-binding protein (MmcQ/YjbR family)